MNAQRPDPSTLDPEIRAYLEALEAEVERLRAQANLPGEAEPAEADETAQAELLEASEPPTTINIITISQAGAVKRTPRHLYNRQRRGGMGIFDLELREDAAPAALVSADESQSLVVLTDRARAFRLPVSVLPASPVRSRGQSWDGLLPLEVDERPAVFLPSHERGYLAVLTAKAWVRVAPAHLVGEKLQPGLTLFKAEEFGAPVAACWTPGDGDLLIATRRGLALRFPEKQVPLTGALGIRLDAARDDEAFALLSVRPESGVFLLGAEGRGTIRLMSGFNANKAPGAGGKMAMKTERLIGALAVKETDDLFIISRLSKIIRFKANEVPAKDGVVQGVNCMALRADETAAVCVSPT